jgi:hypothetical protein
LGDEGGRAAGRGAEPGEKQHLHEHDQIDCGGDAGGGMGERADLAVRGVVGSGSQVVMMVKERREEDHHGHAEQRRENPDCERLGVGARHRSEVGDVAGDGIVANP